MADENQMPPLTTEQPHSPGHRPEGLRRVYWYLAEATILAHFGFVLFVVLGGRLLAYYPAVIWVHAPAAIWSILVTLLDWTCPLTPLETYFRKRSGMGPYHEGFVFHYFGRLVYRDGMARKFELIAGSALLVLTIAVYARHFHLF